MRTYLILKEKARQWNADPEIKAILAEISEPGEATPALGRYSQDGARALLAHGFDRQSLAAKKLSYERLDQITIDILLGVR
jgi:xylose isomerase